MQIDWQMVAAIATCVLAGSLFAAIWQIKVTRKSTNAQLAVNLFRELRSEETKNTLRFIYQLRAEDIQHLCRTDIHNIDSILDKFEMLGGLVNRDVIDKPLAIETYAGASALRCWYQLCQLYIRKEQEKRGYYCENYENFARLSLDYFKKAVVRVKFHLEGEEDKELVFEELQKDELRPRNFAEIRRDRENKKDKREVWRGFAILI